MLFCSTCKLNKPEIAFSRKSDSKRGYSYKCKECHNIYSKTEWYPKNAEKQKESSAKWKKNNYVRYLSQKYNIPVKEVETTLKRANGQCEICGSQENLHFDHCHKHLTARGILCCSCNTLIGRLGDNYEEASVQVKKILKYLSS